MPGTEEQKTLFKQRNSGDKYIPTAFHHMEGKCTPWSQIKLDTACLILGKYLVL